MNVTSKTDELRRQTLDVIGESSVKLFQVDRRMDVHVLKANGGTRLARRLA